MKKFITFLVISVVFTNSWSQPVQFPPGGSVSTVNEPPCGPAPCVPIDGGLGFLLAAGAALGARKISKNKNIVK
jgi:hypothetical protein